MIRFAHVHRDRAQSPVAAGRAAARELPGQRGKAQKRTLANLSKLPAAVIDGLKALLKGGRVIGLGADGLRVERSLPHGHVAAGLGMVRKLALDRLLLSTAKDAGSRRHCDLSGRSTPRPHVPAWGRCWAWGRWPSTRSMRRWIGLSASSIGSRTGWRGAISRTARWCFTTSARPISRDANARWRGSATAAITARTARRSSTACCAPRTACRWRSRCSTATVPTRRRSPPRSTRSSSASGCSAWCRSATAA